MNSDKTSRTCQTCKHFRQHYIRTSRGKYSKCGSGHCVYPLCKPRRCNVKACQNYVIKETQDTR